MIFGHYAQQYNCFYVDHTFFDPRKIGATYTRLHQDLIHDAQSMVIATCQRIEIYTTHENNPLEQLDLPFRAISGMDNLERRLVAICSGIESPTDTSKPPTCRRGKTTHLATADKFLVKRYFLPKQELRLGDCV